MCEEYAWRLFPEDAPIGCDWRNLLLSLEEKFPYAAAKITHELERWRARHEYERPVLLASVGKHDSVEEFSQAFLQQFRNHLLCDSPLAMLAEEAERLALLIATSNDTCFAQEASATLMLFHLCSGDLSKAEAHAAAMAAVGGGE